MRIYGYICICIHRQRQSREETAYLLGSFIPARFFPPLSLITFFIGSYNTFFVCTVKCRGFLGSVSISQVREEGELFDSPMAQQYDVKGLNN